VICPEFVARDLSGFRTAPTRGREWTGRGLTRSFGGCVLRGCWSGMSGGALSQIEAAEMLGSASGLFGVGAIGFATKGLRVWRTAERQELFYVGYCFIV